MMLNQTIIALLLRRRRQRREQLPVIQKRLWIRKIYQERKEKGEYHLLIRDMRLYDHSLFYQQFRMTPTKYEDLLNMVAPQIVKSSLKREAISPGERLAVTLRYLVTGDAQTTIGASYRMSKTSVSRIIKETTLVIWDALSKSGYLKIPHNEGKRRSIAEAFE